MKINFSDNSTNFPALGGKKELALFLEHEDHILLLKRPNGTWDVPGIKVKLNESRSYKELVLENLQKKTEINLYPDQIQFKGHAKIPKKNYPMHIYYSKLKNRPSVQLKGNKHSQYEWVSIYAFKTLPFSKNVHEAFDFVYKDRIWQRIDPSNSTGAQKTQNTSSLVLRKGNKTLLFNKNRRFIFNLLGKPGCGKGTQAEMLSQLFEIPQVSNGDSIRIALKADSVLGKMIKNFEKDNYPAAIPLPDEIHMGLITNRVIERDCQKGFILDGFPRSERQGDMTREVILRENDLNIPLFIDIPESEIWKRINSRSICPMPKCKYQGKFDENNPASKFCPKDGEKLERRADDVDVSKIKRRLEIFESNNEDTLNSMNKRDPVVTLKVNNETPREVLHQICSNVQSRLDHLANAEEMQSIQKEPKETKHDKFCRLKPKMEKTRKVAEEDMRPIADERKRTAEEEMRPIAKEKTIEEEIGIVSDTKSFYLKSERKRKAEEAKRHVCIDTRSDEERIKAAEDYMRLFCKDVSRYFRNERNDEELLP